MASTSSSRVALAVSAIAEDVLPQEAMPVTHEAAGPSWVLLALNFLGAQLVVLPFLGFLSLLSYRFFFQSPGAWITSALLLGGASVVLRRRPGMFITQLAFSALITGLALLVVAMRFRWENPSLLVLLVVLLALALVVRVAWVQRVLGSLAAGVALALTFGGHGNTRWQAIEAFPSITVLVALALLWAIWSAREPQWSVHARARQAAALADGVAVTLLLAAAYASTRHFWSLNAMFGRGPRGSADDLTAGLAGILDLGWPAAVQLALVLGAAAWLVVHWQLRERPRTHNVALLRLLGWVFAVLALACLVVPQVGVVALVGTVALGTGRRALLALAGLTLLAQLSGFYYALQWPLVHKAALLAATGAALALVLWVLRDRQGARAPADPGAKLSRPWLAPLAIALAGAVALGLVHRDVQRKEQVIAQGEKLYLPLAPRDPRSLMQGDYMALNFVIPGNVRQQLKEQANQGLVRSVQVTVRLNPRGVAEVLRVAQDGETLATDERRLELKRLKGDWVLVTDAFYFPEGLGTPFSRARFGEFRALPDGRALLVGLADESLNAIAPAPLERSAK